MGFGLDYILDLSGVQIRYIYNLSLKQKIEHIMNMKHGEIGSNHVTASNF